MLVQALVELLNDIFFFLRITGHAKSFLAGTPFNVSIPPKQKYLAVAAGNGSFVEIDSTNVLSRLIGKYLAFLI